MALFLVQHGISASKNMDPERGLSDVGREGTNRIALVAKGYKILVQKIIQSGKKRAEQTVGIFYEALDLETPIKMISGVNPMNDVRNFAASIVPQENWMVVSHMPFMERLVSFLTTGSEDIRVYQFQNSGIVCLDVEGDKEADWFIKWTLNPNIP